MNSVKGPVWQNGNRGSTEVSILGKEGTTAGKALSFSSLILPLVVFLALFSFGTQPAWATGDDGQALQADAGAALSSQSDASEYYSPYALLKSDGLLYRCNENGVALPGGEVWSSYVNGMASGSIDQFVREGVQVLFIAPDVREVGEINWKLVYYSGETGECPSTSHLSYFPNIQKIEFQLDSTGNNACTILGEKAFHDLYLLDEVINFDKTRVAAIPDLTFNHCEQLVSIAMPNTVTRIGWSAFGGCSKLSRVLFSSSLREIGTYAFCDCSLLGAGTVTSGPFVLDLPESLALIDSYAFKNCQALQYVILRNNHGTVTAGTGIFNGCNKLKAVYVNNYYLVNYADNDSCYNWRDYIDKVHGWLEISKVANCVYSGKAQKPAITVTWLGKELPATTNGKANYTIKYSNNVNAGKGTVTVIGKNQYALHPSVDPAWTVQASKAFKITKAANPMAVKMVAKTVKQSKVKKSAQKAAPLSFKKKAAGTVTFAKVSKGSSKALSIAKNTGIVTVKKKTPKGVYKLVVKVKAKGDKNYKSISQQVTITVKVK